MRDLILFLLVIGMVVSIYKIQSYLYAWFAYKIGVTETKKVLFLQYIICTIVMTLCGFSVLASILAICLLAGYLLKMFSNYSLFRHYMYCYCVSKGNGVSVHVIQQCIKTMDSIWNMASAEVRSRIKKAIDQEEIEYQKYMAAQKTEDNRDVEP